MEDESHGQFFHALQRGDLDDVQLRFEALGGDVDVWKENKSYLCFFVNSFLERMRWLFVGSSLDTKDAFRKRNPLCEATCAGQGDVVRFLLDKGLDPNGTGMNGWTPLCFAIQKNHVELALLLMERGAHVNPRGFREKPLHVAVRRNDYDMAALLLFRGAKASAPTVNRCGDTPLHRACVHGNDTMIRLLWCNGANVDARDSEGRTPIHYCRRLECARLLVEYGADVNAQDSCGYTCLHYNAGCPTNIEMIRLLLQNKADVNIAKSGGCTALHLASVHGQLAVARLLIENGAKLCVQNSLLRTPLHFASSTKGSTEMARLLLEMGASTEDREMSGFTPLHLAVLSGRNDIAEVLLQGGSDVNSIDDKGCTPLCLLIQKTGISSSEQNFISLLARHKANLSAKTPDGHTLLHYVILKKSHSSLAVVRKLLECGANQTVRNDSGDTPLHIACLPGKSQAILDLLIENRPEVLTVKDLEGWLPLLLLCRSDAALDSIYKVFRCDPNCALLQYQRECSRIK